MIGLVHVLIKKTTEFRMPASLAHINLARLITALLVFSLTAFVTDVGAEQHGCETVGGKMALGCNFSFCSSACFSVCLCVCLCLCLSLSLSLSLCLCLSMSLSLSIFTSLHI